MSGAPRVIPVGAELPPLDGGEPPPAGSTGGTDRGRPKGPPRGAKRRAGDRFRTINAFIDVTMAGLRPAERAVWLILWRDTKPNGLAETSQVSLARRAGVTDRAVRSALRRLERLGLVAVSRRGGLNRGP